MAHVLVNTPTEPGAIGGGNRLRYVYANLQSKSISFNKLPQSASDLYFVNIDIYFRIRFTYFTTDNKSFQIRNHYFLSTIVTQPMRPPPPNKYPFLTHNFLT